MSIQAPANYSDWSWQDEVIRAGHVNEFDFSAYSSEHPAIQLMNDWGIDGKANKAILGKVKDEVDGKRITEFVGLKAKINVFISCGRRRAGNESRRKTV